LNYLKPTIDYVFKRIFGDEKSKGILISFLNSLLAETQKSKIKDLEILNPNIEKEYKNDKESRLDIKAKLDNENLVNIEVQIQYDKNIDKRTLYYWSKIYSQQLNTGSAYQGLNKTITINILCFEYFPHQYIHSSYHIRHDKNHEILIDDLEIHMIELPKLLKYKQEMNETLKTWLLFLTDPENSVIEEKKKEMKEMSEAVGRLELISRSKVEREKAWAREKYLNDIATIKRSAEEEGIEKGISIGEKRGISIGKAEGERFGEVKGRATLLCRQILKKFPNIESFYHLC